MNTQSRGILQDCIFSRFQNVEKCNLDNRSENKPLHGISRGRAEFWGASYFPTYFPRFTLKYIAQISHSNQ